MEDNFQLLLAGLALGRLRQADDGGPPTAVSGYEADREASRAASPGPRAEAVPGRRRRGRVGRRRGVRPTAAV